LKTAIIVGFEGQDGKFLYSYLVSKDYRVIGIGRKNISTNFSETIQPIDINSLKEVSGIILKTRPSEIYYLAAHHHSSEDVIKDEGELIHRSYQTNVIAYSNFLESIRVYSPQTRIFYAASSHIFGNPKSDIQNENTEYNPKSIYAITKCSSLQLSKYYRENHGLFCSIGILYNHESHLRADNFVSKKIVKAAVEIKNKTRNELTIGDLDKELDWGYAGDFVEAFVKMLNCNNADNFIVATGKTHKLKDFVRYVFNYLDLDWQKYVNENSGILKRKMDGIYCGDYTKLKSMTGWEPRVDFETLATKMVDKELSNEALKV
jgi:GDPmannose 4,6-dehydratase